MRGKLNLGSNISYYLVARRGTGPTATYFIYQPLPPLPTMNENNPNAVNAAFASIEYPNPAVPAPTLVSIIPTAAAGIYNLKGTLSTGIISNIATAPWPLVNPVGSNILDVSSDTKATPQAIKLVPDSTTNIGTQALWAGVWYNVQDSNGTPLLWKQRTTVTTTGGFRGAKPPDTNNYYPVEAVPLQVMFVPQNAGSSSEPISVWTIPTNGDMPDCTTPDLPDISMILFTAWVTGKGKDHPTGCDGPGWIGTGSNKCAFTSVATCQQGYLYTFCGPGQSCGACLGPCPEQTDMTTPVCTFDYDPTWKAENKSPYNCNPKNPEPLSLWEKYKTLWIILIIVGAIIVLIIIIAIGVLISRRHTNAMMTKLTTPTTALVTPTVQVKA